MSSERFGDKVHPDIAHINFFSREEIERATALHAIKRFQAIKEMTHRTSVLEHELRVSKHSIVFSRVLLALGIEVDLPRVLFFADHHDDVEIETGDISTPQKISASQEERVRIEEDEREAAKKVDHLIQKPLLFRSFPEEYEEYKSQKTLEARIVNYADKWDGLHEAIHEVVCGENPKDFKEVINGYRPTFEELGIKNKDWHDKLKVILDNDFFDFPDPEKLTLKSSEKLSYKTVGNFIKSIAEGNPRSYFFWLRSNKSVFGLDFLERTFPGWMDKFPQPTLKDIKRVRDKHPFKTTASGLWVPSTETNIGNLTFGESMELNIFEIQLTAIASFFPSTHGMYS